MANRHASVYAKWEESEGGKKAEKKHSIHSREVTL
jgi:hypothetical protein